MTGRASRSRRSGDLDDVSPSVGAAIYRIAQESITNSVRHARGLTSIDVRVEGDEDCVRLTVHDDGDHGLPGEVVRRATAWSG